MAKVNLPRDAQLIRRAPVGYNWLLYYSPNKRRYYKLTPNGRGGHTVQSGTSIQSCCGGR